MLMLCVITLPMARAARALGAVPRLLADDCTIHTSGQGHWRALQRAGDVAMTMLTEAGAKVSQSKCVSMSTGKLVRVHMRCHVWPAIRARIEVKLDIRDLGTHVSFGTWNCTGTHQTQYFECVWRMPRCIVMGQRMWCV